MAHAAFFRSLASLYRAGATETLRYCVEATGHLDCSLPERMIPAIKRRLIFILSRQATVIDVDPVIAQRLGCTREELIGQNPYSIMAPQRRAYRWARYMEVVTSGKPLCYTDRGEQGHHYELLLMPVIYDSRVESVLVFAAENEHREFTEILPDGTERQL